MPDPLFKKRGGGGGYVTCSTLSPSVTIQSYPSIIKDPILSLVFLKLEI